MGILLQVDMKEVEMGVSRLLEAGRSAQSKLKAAWRRATSAGHHRLRDILRSGSGKHPRYRSGGLMRSYIFYPDDANMTYRIASDSPYAVVQEKGTKGKGGTMDDIKSKRPGGYLAIPLQTNKAEREGGALNKRGFLSGKFSKHASLRDYGKLEVIRLRDGKLYLAEILYSAKKGKGSIKFLFRLVKSVAIPPRPYLRPTAEFTRREVMRETIAAVAEVFGGVK